MLKIVDLKNVRLSIKLSEITYTLSSNVSDVIEGDTLYYTLRASSEFLPTALNPPVQVVR